MNLSTEFIGSSGKFDRAAWPHRMVKVIRPLFSDEARGRIADIGSYRRGKHGPEFIAQGRPTDLPPSCWPGTETRWRRAGGYARGMGTHTVTHTENDK